MINHILALMYINCYMMRVSLLFLVLLPIILCSFSTQIDSILTFAKVFKYIICDTCPYKGNKIDLEGFRALNVTEEEIDQYYNESLRIANYLYPINYIYTYINNTKLTGYMAYGLTSGLIFPFHHNSTTGFGLFVSDSSNKNEYYVLLYLDNRKQLHKIQIDNPISIEWKDIL